MKPARIITPLFALLGLFGASSSFATEAHFSHTFFGNSGGNYTMVACSYAESVVEDFMTKFGASNVSINCFGGIQPYGVSPITVNVSYDAPVLTGETRTEKVVIESDTWNSNCFYDTNLMRSLVREFPNVKATHTNDGCFRTDSRYSYLFLVTTKK